MPRVGGFELAGKDYFSNLSQGIAESEGRKKAGVQSGWPEPSIGQSGGRGEPRGRFVQHGSSRHDLPAATARRGHGLVPHPLLPPPFSIAHRTHQSSREGTFPPVFPSYWESASHAYLHGMLSALPRSPSHFLSQIAGANALCAPELVGRRFHWLECLVGPSGLERDQRGLSDW